jgi:hypothetical protein
VALFGIDPDTTCRNRSGRPIPIGSDGQIVLELIG